LFAVALKHLNRVGIAMDDALSPQLAVNRHVADIWIRPHPFSSGIIDQIRYDIAQRIKETEENASEPLAVRVSPEKDGPVVLDTLRARARFLLQLAPAVPVPVKPHPKQQTADHLGQLKPPKPAKPPRFSGSSLMPVLSAPAVMVKPRKQQMVTSIRASLPQPRSTGWQKVRAVVKLLALKVII
jgi:hypothetical protein